MKRSVNFSYTKKPRNPYKDMAKFMQQMGCEDAEIIDTVKAMSEDVKHDAEQSLELDRGNQD